MLSPMLGVLGGVADFYVYGHMCKIDRKMHVFCVYIQLYTNRKDRYVDARLRMHTVRKLNMGRQVDR